MSVRSWGAGMVSYFSWVRLCVTLWTVTCQAPLSMGFSRQDYWVGCHSLLQGIFLTQGLNLCFLRLLHWRVVLYHWRHLGSPAIGVTWCEVAQWCPTLWDPMDCSLPGSSVHGILQARILEGVALSRSRGSSKSRDRTWVSCIAGRRFTIWATRAYFLAALISIGLPWWLRQ